MTKTPAKAPARLKATARAAARKEAAQPAVAAPRAGKVAETLQRIPHAQLYVAPENARFGAKDLGDLGALAASIAEVGDLIDPVHVYPGDDGRYAVWDGGRRWHAIEKLRTDAKTKVPEAIASQGVPCLVSESRAEALVLSAATFNREAMHPADEFLHYKRMLDAGAEPQRIAAACAVPTPRVNQLLRLAGAAPAILDAFKAGDLALDVVEAFTLSTDPTCQLAVLKAVGWPQKSPTAHAVRQAFRKDAVDPEHDRHAKLVSREDYEAAGGTFLLDLFGGGETWANGGLVKKLGEAAWAKKIEKIKAEGWADVRYVDYHDYNWNRGLVQQKKPEAGYTKEFMATAVVFVKQQHNGQLDVLRGWCKPKKYTTAAGAAAAKPDQALYGYGHGGHYEMTLIAGEAVRVALANDPAAAYDAMLSHLAWVALKRRVGFGFYAGQSGVQTASKLVGEERRLELPVEGSTEFRACRQAWAERLPDDRVAFCDAVAALSAEDKADLLAICFAETVEACEDRFDNRKPTRWAHLGWMARRAGVDMAKAWTPGEDFLKKGSKDALILACQQTYDGPEKLKAKIPDMKKGDLVKQVAADAKAKGWVPKLLRDLVPPVRENPDEATLETLSDAELLILAEIAHKHRHDPFQYQLSPESGVETVVPIQRLEEADRLTIRPLQWGGFFGLVGVGGQDCLRPNERTFEAAKRPDAPKVSVPYKTGFLNPPAADGEPSAALVALATGKAAPIDAGDEDQLDD